METIGTTEMDHVAVLFFHLICGMLPHEWETGTGNRVVGAFFFHSWSFMLLNSQYEYGCGRLPRVFHLYPETPPDRKSWSGNIDPMRRGFDR